MRTTQQFSITLPTEMAGLVKSKVASGDYATESEVIRDGLRALMARDRAVENWLQNQVGPAYDALTADPSRAVPIAQVRKRLATLNPPDLDDMLARFNAVRHGGEVMAFAPEPVGTATQKPGIRNLRKSTP